MSKPTTALIIDDEPHVRVFLRLLLAELGVKRTWEASNGEEGLGLIEEHDPKLVLLDLNLPVLGGLEVLKRLSTSHPELPVLIVSSQNTSSAVVECQKYGAIGYLLKHTPRAQLLETMREALDGLDDEAETAAPTENT